MQCPFCPTQSTSGCLSIFSLIELVLSAWSCAANNMPSLFLQKQCSQFSLQIVRVTFLQVNSSSFHPFSFFCEFLLCLSLLNVIFLQCSIQHIFLTFFQLVRESSLFSCYAVFHTLPPSFLFIYNLVIILPCLQNIC